MKRSCTRAVASTVLLGLIACTPKPKGASDTSPATPGASATAPTATHPTGPRAEALRITQGPMLGDLTPDHVLVWTRLNQAPSEGVCLELLNEQGAVERRLPALATCHVTRPNDCTLLWRVNDLQPGSMHPYRIVGVQGSASRTAEGVDGVIHVPTSHEAHGTLAIGSCADEKDGTQRLLRTIAGMHPDAVAFIGDTPYIDTTDLAQQRRRYGEFLGQPGMAELLSSVPLYSVWDDHDFGQNDTDGRLKGKERSLQAFKEWHANPQFGTGDEGVFHRFRVGPMEVFMLDTRWFSRTQRCAPSDAADPVVEGTALPHEVAGWSLLGREQWRWLRHGLRDSTAPIKVIASGIVFNSSVRPLKTDFWGMYPEEYERLMRTIGETRASGVVLVSGDVHNSRLLRHPTAALAGSDLWEVVSSPMHAGVHDSRLWSRSDWVQEHFSHPNMMALLTATIDAADATLRAKFVDKDGVVFMDRELVRVPVAAVGAAAHGADGREPAVREGRVTPDAHAALASAVSDRAMLHLMRRTLEPWLMDAPASATTAGRLAGERVDPQVASMVLHSLMGGAESAATLRCEPISTDRTRMTAYASPRLRAEPTGTPRTALFVRPTALARDALGPSRTQWLEDAKRDPAAHPVLAYGADEFEVYIAGVNGSVQLEGADGALRCLVHDGTNERPYKSVAKVLIDEGALGARDATLDGLRALWSRAPDVVRAACDRNERVVYWREEPCGEWPRSPFGLRLEPGLAVAVDAKVVPIGSLLLIVPEPATDAPAELARPRLVYAADCGGAIQGADRIDLYLGAGPDALERAGRLNAMVRVYALSPAADAPTPNITP